MPLTEPRRQQLDGIIMQMKQNNEPEEKIRFVVGDFKGKYENEAPPTPQKTVFGRAKDFVSGAADTVKDVGIGAVKGFAQTGSSGAELLGKVTGITPVGITPEFKQSLESTNDAQKVGKFAEQVGEFVALPGAGAAKGVRGVARTVFGRAAPEVVEAAPKIVQKGAKAFLGRSLMEGTEQAALSAAQKGNLNDVGTDFAIGAASPAAGMVAKGVGKVASNAVKTISSKLSGVPTAAIEEAIRNPTLVSGAIDRMAKDPELGPEKVLKLAESSFDDLLKSRAQAYREGLQKIENETMQTKAGKWYVKKFDKELGQTLFVPTDFSLKGVKDVATKTLKEFGAAAKGQEVNLDDIPLPNSYKRDLQEVVDKIYNWKKLSPMGLDDLRENLDVYYRNSLAPSPADDKFNAILTRVKQNLSNYVSDRVPQIGEMNKQFSADSEVIRTLRKELSLGRDKPAVVTRKLLNIFNPKSTTYNQLLESLGEQKAKELKADIAGLLMSKWTPEGLGAYLSTALGAGGITAAAVNPATLPATVFGALASSPRIVGKTATNFGKVIQSELPKKATVFGKKLIKGGAAQLSK